MHQQIRTSPLGDEGPDQGLSHQDRLRARLDALELVNIEGVAPELAPNGGLTPARNHFRFAFGHDAWNAAWEALEPWQPEACPAIAVALSNEAGGLRGALDRLTKAGYGIESVLVLARQTRDGRTLVSIGLDKPVPPAAWVGLGGWDEPGEMPPEEVSAS